MGERRGCRGQAQRRASALAILVLLLAFPSASAVWRGYGTFEPDSAFDHPSYLWFEPPPADAPPRIYFQAFPSHTQVTNPNVGLLGSQVEPPGQIWWNAMLGIWTDCNGDGYVGHFETALEEYRDELLVDKTRCPTGASAHNADGWVSELRWIGLDGGIGNGARDPRVVVDPQAMVWGDMGKPFPTGSTAAGRSCALLALPQGTLQRTGAFLAYADCIAGHQLGTTWNTALRLVDPEDSQGLALEDRRMWDEEGHPLNQPTLGDEDSAHAFVTLSDCSKPSVLEGIASPWLDLVPAEAGLREGARALARHGPHPPPPDGPSVNPNGNVAGTVNRTREDLHTGDGADGRASNCDTSDDRGRDLYGVETENTEIRDDAKNSPDVNFNFTAQRRHAISGVGAYYAGLWWGVHWDESGSPTRWMAAGGSARVPTLVRSDATLPNATHWTFYAFVGGRSLQEAGLPGGVGVYGAPFCPHGFGTGAGRHHGWECDADLWHRNADGSRKTERYPLARPGSAYNLRDVDCFDGTLTPAAPVGVGTQRIGPAPCAPPKES